MKKELFIESLKALEQQFEFDTKAAESLEVLFPDVTGMYYDNRLIRYQLEKVLKVEMADDTQDSWIDYFIYELDFGKQYKHGCATMKDGSNINLSDASNLYDFLIKEQEGTKEKETVIEEAPIKRICFNCGNSALDADDIPCISCRGGSEFKKK